MTDFFVWLPFGVVGVAIMIFLAITRWPDELEAVDAERTEPAFGAGSVRLAAVLHSEVGLVIDGLVDRLSPLGSVGAPVTLVVSEAGMGEADYRLLSQWVASDAVVDIAVPMRSDQRVVDLRSGEDEMRLAIVGLSS